MTPETAPLGLFGSRASEAVTGLLDARRIVTHLARYPESPFAGGTLRLRPGDGQLHVDAVVSLPRLHGPFLSGIAHDRLGFISVDEHGRVHGSFEIWAAGDVTGFPIKQGGLATQQADAVAAAIAHAAGAPVAAEPFRPVLRGRLLLPGAAPRYLRTDMSGRSGDTSDVAAHPLWWPPAVAGSISPRICTDSTARAPARRVRARNRATRRRRRARVRLQPAEGGRRWTVAPVARSGSATSAPEFAPRGLRRRAGGAGHGQA